MRPDAEELQQPGNVGLRERGRPAVEQDPEHKIIQKYIETEQLT